MKKLLFILTLLFCIFSFTNCCKKDRIDHTDDNYIYAWMYKANGDSVLYKYRQPIFHSTVITNKYKRRYSHYVGVPGKGGHMHWVTYYYTFYYINDKEVKETGSYIYNKVNIGTKIKVREQFYPYYKREIVEIYN